MDAYFGKTFAYSLKNNFSIIKSTFKDYVLVDAFFCGTTCNALQLIEMHPSRLVK